MASTIDSRLPQPHQVARIMPRTSPIAQPVRQCTVALNAARLSASDPCVCWSCVELRCISPSFTRFAHAHLQLSRLLGGSDDLVGEVGEVGDGPGLDEAHRPLVAGLAEEALASPEEELPQVPRVAGSCVQGIVPRRLAAISLRSAGSQTRTVSAWASATSAVIAAGLGATTCWRSSLVTIISSKSPSSPSAPAIQFAFMILTRRAS